MPWNKLSTNGSLCNVCLSTHAFQSHLLPAAYNRVHAHHYNCIIMGEIASQITSLTIVYTTVYSDVDQRIHRSSASLAYLRGIDRGPVNSPHKWPVTRIFFFHLMTSPCISLIYIRQWGQWTTHYCMQYRNNSLCVIAIYRWFCVRIFPWQQVSCHFAVSNHDARGKQVNKSHFTRICSMVIFLYRIKGYHSGFSFTNVLLPQLWSYIFLHCWYASHPIEQLAGASPRAPIRPVWPSISQAGGWNIVHILSSPPGDKHIPPLRRLADKASFIKYHVFS